VTYRVQTGDLYADSGKWLGSGYSGHGDGVNNVSEAGIPNVGPIPPGCVFDIGAPGDHIGPLSFPLTLQEGSTTRSGFYIHGDNQAHNETASEGCIVMGPEIRSQIADLLDAGDNELNTI
jgi:hypothetical protein